MRKTKLNYRLDEEVVERLMLLHSEQKIPLSDLISNALDALEREQKMPETIIDQVEKIQKDLSEFLVRFEQRMEDASVNEKERLRSLLRLLESKLTAHDQAEQERFERLASHNL